MLSPLADFDEQLVSLISSEDNEMEFDNEIQCLMHWLKYPNILDWLGYYLISEYFQDQCPLPAPIGEVKFSEQSFYENTENQSSPGIFYIIIKSMCLYYESNWTKLAELEPSVGEKKFI